MRDFGIRGFSNKRVKWATIVEKAIIIADTARMLEPLPSVTEYAI